MKKLAFLILRFLIYSVSIPVYADDPQNGLMDNKAITGQTPFLDGEKRTPPPIENER